MMQSQGHRGGELPIPGAWELPRERPGSWGKREGLGGLTPPPVPWAAAHGETAGARPRRRRCPLPCRCQLPHPSKAASLTPGPCPCAGVPTTDVLTSHALTLCLHKALGSL